MISLSVYGDPGNPLYAAVWVQRGGPAWEAVHGVDSNGYQSFFNNWTAKGYVPVLVSATGTISNAVFAAVFEQGISGPWFARHGMTSGPAANAGTFQNENSVAAAGKMILRSVAIYGTAVDRRYAAVWHPNPGYVKWHAHPSDTGASYQVVFNAETQLPGFQLNAYRPAYVAVSGDVMYCSVFKDDVVGAWVARHGMTGADYQTEFNQQVANGFYPICTQGGGTTSAPVYAAIFAKQDIPASREWTVTGAAVPSLAGFDHAMQSFMQGNGVRAAQLAIGKNGVSKFSRGYTWAEPGYRVTQPSDRFLLASCSKMFLEARGPVPLRRQKADIRQPPSIRCWASPTRSTRAATPSPFRNFWIIPAATTIRRPAPDFDPTYNMRTIALALGLTQPVKKLDVARYMYGKMLDFTPGTNNKYSNYGYLLAGSGGGACNRHEVFRLCEANAASTGRHQRGAGDFHAGLRAYQQRSDQRRRGLGPRAPST